MSWKDHDFEIPLGISFPEKPVSKGLDWIEDCEEDGVFGLKPEFYSSKNQYDAALKLCRICAGWFYFDNEEEKKLAVEAARRTASAGTGNPMRYYNTFSCSFDWVSALRENNELYADRFYDIDTLWQLFTRLAERSYIEKADCFEWFISYFADDLKFDVRNELQNNYVSCYDRHMESILYLRPDHAEILTTGVTAVTADNAYQLSGVAAGLIRMGKRRLGLDLYKKLFEMVWTCKSTTDDKKRVVDGFLDRLSCGFEDEPYIDDEIADLLNQQSRKFSDAKWTAKIKTSIGRNRA